MELNILTAISPIDGRYRGKAEPFAGYFSEYALIKYRVFVEIEYFIALCELPIPQLEGVDKAIFPRLREIYKGFTLEDATRVKNIEKVTNHDVKAVEYFIMAADKGYIESQYELGVCYEKGYGVKQDKSKAIEWYKAAAAQGYEKAKTALKRLGA